MTTTDTRAALAKLLDDVACRRCDHDDPIGDAGREEIDRAIAAHVAAEVPTPDEARRLVEAHHLDLLSIADAVASLHGATGPGLRGHCVAQADRLRRAADEIRALGFEA